MLRFIDDSYDLSLAYGASYDYFWVLVSYLVACLAAYTAWTMADNLKYQKVNQGVWHVGGSIAMGSGIWCMHFVGMLAFQLPIAVAYDPLITLVSMLPAILASGVAIYQFGQPRLDINKVAFNAIIMGAGIGTMHYVGMAAMRTNAIMAYDFRMFLLSIFVAVVLAFIALSAKFLYQKMALSQGRNWLKLGSVLLMGLSISGMHYTAMAAVYYFPSDQATEVTDALPTTPLGLMVLLFSVLLLALALVATIFERRMRHLAINLDTSRKRMLDAIESISEGFVMFDQEGRLVMANTVYHGMYPELEDELCPGAEYRELLYHKAALKRDGDEYVERKLDWHQNADGSFEESVSDGRKFLGRECRSISGDLIGVWSDVSELKKVQDKLVAQSAQLRQILDILPVAIFIQEADNDKILYANTAGHNLNQQLQLEVEGKVKRSIQQCEEYKKAREHAVERGAIFDYELNLTVDGALISVLLSATKVLFEDKHCVLFSIIDISERKANEEQLRYMATTDSLTQLSNRRHFLELAREHVSRCIRNKLPLSVFMLDIDHFKGVNDNHSHAIGDKVIKEVAITIKKELRDGDIVGRLGGEEFAVVLADKERDSAKQIAERVRKSIQKLEFKNLKFKRFSVTISIGISSLNGRDISEDKLLVEADHALYEAKHGGRNKSCEFEN